MSDSSLVDSFWGVARGTGILFLGTAVVAGAVLIPQSMPILDKAGASILIGCSATYDALGGAVLGGMAAMAVGGITRLATIFSKSAAAKHTTAAIAEGIGWAGLIGGAVLGLGLGFASAYSKQTDVPQNNPQAWVEIQKATRTV